MANASDFIGNAEMFPVLNEWTFFNHAGVSPLPKVAGDAMVKFADGAQKRAYIDSGWFTDIEKLRVLSAKIINAHRDEIAFVKNTSEGLAIVAAGLDWKAGDVIVTSAVEYPANIYPWMEVARRFGATLVMVPEQTMPDGTRQIPIDDILKAAADPKCRLVTLSHIEYASGQRHDVARIGKYCRENGKLFCVDAIQSIGIVPVDVQTMYIDYLSADGHKWMLGPEGAGIFYCRRELLESTRPLTIGWMNVINAQDYGNYDFTLKPDAGRYECGSHNVPGLLSLFASLTMLHDVGIDFVHERVQALLDLASAGLRAKGYTVISPRTEAEQRSGILSFTSHAHSHDAIIKTMKDNKIEMAKREGRLRISPHFYNTEAQIDRVIALLPTH